MPEEKLKEEIRNGNSMTLSFPEYNIISSAIVGGILPIALGISLKLKMEMSSQRVFCWLGDMTAEGGSFYECSKYAAFLNLPIVWVVEDNGISVCTPTEAVWGDMEEEELDNDVIYYEYKSKYPHAGAGIRVQF